MLQCLEQRPRKVRRDEQDQLLRGLMPAEQDVLLHLDTVMSPFRATLIRVSRMQERLKLLERLEQRPLKVRREEQDQLLRGLTPAEQDALLDLRPFMQRNPCMVHSDASLSRAYRLFRTMGLRHLFVCQPQPRVRMVTLFRGVTCSVQTC